MVAFHMDKNSGVRQSRTPLNIMSTDQKIMGSRKDRAYPTPRERRLAFQV